MHDAWQALRQTDKGIALCLLFAPRAQRALLADLFNLASELENAIRIPSEVMLAAIRLQWWHDALDSTEDASAPLVIRLQGYVADGAISRPALMQLVGEWQTRIGDDESTADECWSACWHLAASLKLDPEFAALAANTGRMMIALKRGQTPTTLPTKAELAALYKAGHNAHWLYLANRLIQHLAQNEQRDDPLLVWRLLFWRFGL